jgi:hypothetical protein
MPADVVVRPKRAVTVAEDDDAFVSNWLEKVIARMCDLVDPTDAKPPLRKDALKLLGQDVGRHIIAAGQGTGAVDGNLRGLEELGHDGLAVIGILNYAGRSDGKEGWLTGITGAA